MGDIQLSTVGAPPWETVKVRGAQGSVLSREWL